MALRPHLAVGLPLSWAMYYSTWPDPVFCTKCYESMSTDSSSSGFPGMLLLATEISSRRELRGVR